ncbi:MAG: iron/manganese transporter [Ignavibacteria bacterium]|nr:iron/manganese transporter [Ignavibacteria bacterium]
MKHFRKSLEQINSSVDTTNVTGSWRKLFAFIGPAYLVSVGYMDPGNWATDIAGGSKFGYSLVWVLVMSNLIALLVQSLSARLGIVKGLDLAQMSRAYYPKYVNYFLWFFAEIAIAATDLAEVLGMAIGLNLLFGLDLITGVSITVLDTFIIMLLMNRGMRRLEAFILGLISIIGIAFIIQMIFAQPVVGDIFKNIIPNMPSEEALYIAIGIIGATVMPHNLYLHSSLVQTRNIDRSKKGLKQAIKYNFIDSAIALNMALFVNAAILILAASTFYTTGNFFVQEIKDAHRLLAPLLGSELAPILFAVALIAAGQSSTLTGTLSGQIVMEGYLNIRLQPWLRRLITRLLAIIPAVICISLLGEGSTTKLLILSQVILSLQLGFAVIPLIHFVSSKMIMNDFYINKKTKLLAWLSAGIIVSLNIKMVLNEISNWIQGSPSPIWIYFIVIPLSIAIFSLLLFITFEPLVQRFKLVVLGTPHGAQKDILIVKPAAYKRIAVAVDFSNMDDAIINQAVSQGGKEAEYILLHVVETAGARMMQYDILDIETSEDKNYLLEYSSYLQNLGYSVSVQLGFGNPNQILPKLINELKADLLVMGSHGHNRIMSILFGRTLDKVQRLINIPVLVVKK